MSMVRFTSFSLNFLTVVCVSVCVYVCVCVCVCVCLSYLENILLSLSQQFHSLNIIVLKRSRSVLAWSSSWSIFNCIFSCSNLPFHYCIYKILIIPLFLLHLIHFYCNTDGFKYYLIIVFICTVPLLRSLNLNLSLSILCLIW